MGGARPCEAATHIGTINRANEYMKLAALSKALKADPTFVTVDIGKDFVSFLRHNYVNAMEGM